MTLKHTDFIRKVGKRTMEVLDPPYSETFRIGRSKYQCQIQFEHDWRMHYEVSRVWNQNGRQLEIGLHFESRSKHLNKQLIEEFDKHLFELRDQLGDGIRAERWDRGWTKVYEIYPDQDLTEELVDWTAQRLAHFIKVLHPIYRTVRRALA